MDKHKKTSVYSNDVIMGHLEFVMLNRLDISKRIIDKIDGKVNSYAPNYLKVQSNFSLIPPLVNQLSDGHFADLKKIVGLTETLLTRLNEIVVNLADVSKNMQKELNDLVITRTWSFGSPCTSSVHIDAFFELFIIMEKSIEFLYRTESNIDKYVEDVYLMFPEVMELSSRVTLLVSEKENKEESDDDDEEEIEESEDDDEEGDEVDED